MSAAVRHARAADLDALAAAEAVCFPPAEAASRESLRGRLAVYPAHFWLLEQDGQLAAYADGFVSDSPALTDDMYADPSLHREDGAWQMIFGVGTLPAYRGRGLASQVLRQAEADARAQGRLGLVLTCKQALAPFYARLGYRSEGVSSSEHGGAVWLQMRLRF